MDTNIQFWVNRRTCFSFSSITKHADQAKQSKAKQPRAQKKLRRGICYATREEIANAHICSVNMEQWRQDDPVWYSHTRVLLELLHTGLCGPGVLQPVWVCGFKGCCCCFGGCFGRLCVAAAFVEVPMNYISIFKCCPPVVKL